MLFDLFAEKITAIRKVSLSLPPFSIFHLLQVSLHFLIKAPCRTNLGKELLAAHRNSLLFSIKNVGSLQGLSPCLHFRNSLQGVSLSLSLCFWLGDPMNISCLALLKISSIRWYCDNPLGFSSLLQHFLPLCRWPSLTSPSSSLKLVCPKLKNSLLFSGLFFVCIGVWVVLCLYWLIVWSNIFIQWYCSLLH
jgi:hypothetical protein